jgi:amidophosphoribosyltransferase
MAAELGADTLRYLPVDSVASAIQKAPADLCRGCITGEYPTPWGQKLYDVALDRYDSQAGDGASRTYETEAATS